jgi:hypothetical protein
MVDSTKKSEQQKQPLNLANNAQREKHRKINDINYRNNLASNYTEKIQELDDNFDYASNSAHYWSEPGLSVLYGTPLYEEASPSQKLALNHLYWAAEYDHVAASEASTVQYNQVTAGVFSHFSDYETLCLSLFHETEQEHSHIHAFHTIAYKTKIALLGKALLGNNPKKTKSLVSAPVQQVFNFNWASSPFSDSQYKTLRSITQMMLKSQTKTYSYSSYLQDLENQGKFVPAFTKGYFGVAIPRPLLQFFNLNWGSTPFLACQHYFYRYSGNMYLKNFEHGYYDYFKNLEAKGEFIPTPTAVSYYHLLDESFHTTTSQLLARDIYKDFPKPTAYEQLVANLLVYMMQTGFVNGISAALVAVFRPDINFMPFVYKLLRSRVFDMSEQEAIQWMEKCFCQEHEGFHQNFKYHQRLLKNIRQLTSGMEYLWPINREMRIMAESGSINKALARNTKALRNFSESIAC